MVPESLPIAEAIEALRKWVLARVDAGERLAKIAKDANLSRSTLSDVSQTPWRATVRTVLAVEEYRRRVETEQAEADTPSPAQRRRRVAVAAVGKRGRPTATAS